MYRMHFISERNVEEFERIRSEIDRVTDGAARGEFTTDDLKTLIARGTAYAGYLTTDDGAVKLAWVWEMVFYPRKTKANLIAMAGSGFRECCEHWYEYMKDVWRSQGAVAVTCYTSPAMARFLSRAGFFEQYRFLEMELDDAKHE